MPLLRRAGRRRSLPAAAPWTAPAAVPAAWARALPRLPVAAASAARTSAAPAAASGACSFARPPSLTTTASAARTTPTRGAVFRARFFAPSRRVITGVRVTGTTPRPAAGSTALPRRFIPARPTTRNTPTPAGVSRECSFTRSPRLAAATSASGSALLPPVASQARSIAPVRRLTATTSVAGTAATLAAGSRVYSFAPPVLLVPTIPATDATFLLPGVDRTQVCSILTPNVRSGTMRQPAAVFRARAFARSLRLTATVSVADEPPAAPVLPEPVRVATAAPAVTRFPRIAVHWVPSVSYTHLTLPTKRIV